MSTTATMRMKSPLDVKDIDAHNTFDKMNSSSGALSHGSDGDDPTSSNTRHRSSKGTERASLVQAVLAKTSPDLGHSNERRSSTTADPSKYAKLRKIKQAMNTLVSDKPSTAAGTADSKRESIPPTITSEELAQLSSLLGVNHRGSGKNKQSTDDNECETKSKLSLGSLEKEQGTTTSEPTTVASGGSRGAPSRRQAPQRTRSRSLTELDRRKKEKRRGKKPAEQAERTPKPIDPAYYPENKPRSKNTGLSSPHFNFHEPRPRRRHSIGTACTGDSGDETYKTESTRKSRKNERNSLRGTSTLRDSLKDSFHGSKETTSSKLRVDRASTTKSDPSGTSGRRRDYNKRSDSFKNDNEFATSRTRDRSRSKPEDNNSNEIIATPPVARTRDRSRSKLPGGSDATRKLSKKDTGSKKEKELATKKESSTGESTKAGGGDGTTKRTSKKEQGELRTSKKESKSSSRGESSRGAAGEEGGEEKKRGRPDRRDKKRASEAGIIKKTRSKSDRAGSRSLVQRSRSLGASAANAAKRRGNNSKLRNSESGNKLDNLRGSTRNPETAGRVSVRKSTSQGTQENAASASAATATRKPLKNREHKRGSYGGLLTSSTKVSPKPRSSTTSTRRSQVGGLYSESVPDLGYNTNAPSPEKTPKPRVRRSARGQAPEVDLNASMNHLTVRGEIAMDYGYAAPSEKATTLAERREKRARDRRASMEF